MGDYTTYLILDSGSDVHCFESSEHLNNFRKRPMTVKAFGDTTVTLSGFGSWAVSVLADGKLEPGISPDSNLNLPKSTSNSVAVTC